jgi:hypothetical protein
MKLAQQEAKMADEGAIGNAVKLIGELAILPGTSQLLDGNITSGAAHAAIGWAAGALLGLPGLILVAANSYSQSVSNKGLYDYVQEMIPGMRSSVAAAPTAP